MTWFKVDDSFYDHPKTFDAPDCAVALWIRAGTWSARNLTDGFVPTGMPARLCDDHDTAVKELVRRGLWSRTSGGYRYHDWHEYQPVAQDVKDLRTKRAEAGRRGGLAKAARHGQPVANSQMAESSRSGNSSHSAADPTMWGGVDSQATTERPAATSAGRSDVAKQTASNGLASATDVAKQNAAPSRPDPKGRGSVDLSGGGSDTRASPEPPPRCPRHLEDPDPPPCGPCADARRAHVRWEATEAKRRATLPTCRRHRGQPAHNCAVCRSEQLASPEE